MVSRQSQIEKGDRVESLFWFAVHTFENINETHSFRGLSPDGMLHFLNEFSEMLNAELNELNE